MFPHECEMFAPFSSYAVDLVSSTTFWIVFAFLFFCIMVVYDLVMKHDLEIKTQLSDITNLHNRVTALDNQMRTLDHTIYTDIDQLRKDIKQPVEPITPKPSEPEDNSDESDTEEE